MSDWENTYTGICRFVRPGRPRFPLMRLPQDRRARDGHLEMVAHFDKKGRCGYDSQELMF